MDTRPMCRHCGKKRVNRPRGCCWGCYYTPGVKELYPPTSKYAHRGVGNGNSGSPLPAGPTDAAPGSMEKIAVLVARAERGESLFHPNDVRVSPHRSREKQPYRVVGSHVPIIHRSVMTMAGREPAPLAPGFCGFIASGGAA